MNSVSSPTSPQLKLQLFEKVFGEQLSQLKKEEWIQINIRTGQITKRVFGELAPEHYRLMEDSLTGENAIAIMLKVASMLLNGKNSVEAHSEKDFQIINVAHKVFKRIKKDIKRDEWKDFSSEIVYYLSTQLNFQKKLREWDGSAAYTQLNLSEMPTKPSDSMIARLGQDIQRHFREEDLVRVEGLEIKSLNRTASEKDLSGSDTPPKKFETRAERFEALLNALVDRLCENKLKAVALKRNWRGMSFVCLNEQSFAAKIQEIYNLLSTIGDPDTAKLLYMLRALNQTFYVVPSLSVRGALTAILQPEAHSHNQQQLLKDISEGYGIHLKFDESFVSIVYHNRSINNDHPTFPETDEQKRTLEKYRTECKFELNVKNTMTAKLDQLDRWNSSITVEIGIPSQSKLGKDKEAVEAVVQALKIAGYKIEIRDLESNIAWVKAR